MKTPSWQEIEIPKTLVESIKQLKSGHTLDILAHQIVFHNNKKISVSYHCRNCGHTHSAKPNEEVSQCDMCFSKKVHCIQSLRFNKSNLALLPHYSRKGFYLVNFMSQMYNNFRHYFNCSPEKNVDWGWHNDAYHVACWW